MSQVDVSRAVWRKPRRSTNGGACVEVAGVWRKSSRSSNGGNCVEAAPAADRAIAVRDSKNPDGGHLDFTPSDWAAMLTAVKSGKFDR